MAENILAFSNAQTSAPALSGTVGVGITLLDAVLVNGYNSFSVSTITVTANVATVTTSGAHGLVANDNVEFSGANESVFNDRFTVLDVLSSTQFRFEVVTATASATGTISGKIPSLGWTKAFSGTNLAVYRAPAGNRYYLRVDDTNAQYMAVRMFETMTDVSTGTGGSGTVYWRKSSTSDSTARAWFIVGGARGFYFTSGWNATYPIPHYVGGFGDFVSYKENDLYNTLLIGTNSTTISYFGQYQGFSLINIHPAEYSECEAGNYLMRDFRGLNNRTSFSKVSAVMCGYVSTMIDDYNTRSQMGYNFNNFPNPATNGIMLKPMDIIESTYGGYLATRGIIPGAFAPCETVGWTFTSGTRITVQGKKFMGVVIATRYAMNTQNSGNRGAVFFDVTSDWWA